jgi:hypothetical protein
MPSKTLTWWKSIESERKMRKGEREYSTGGPWGARSRFKRQMAQKWRYYAGVRNLGETQRTEHSEQRANQRGSKKLTLRVAVESTSDPEVMW